MKPNPDKQNVVTAAQEAAPNSTGAEKEIHSDDERQEVRFRGICQVVEGGSWGECGFHAHSAKN
jgi:hypothetical protein